MSDNKKTSVSYSVSYIGTDGDMANLKIGGRNLAKKPINYTRKSNNIDADESNIIIKTFDKDTYFNILLHSPLEANQEYTLSCVVNGLDEPNNTWTFPLFNQNNPLRKALPIYNNGKVSVTFSLPADSIYIGNDLIFMDDLGTRPIENTQNVVLSDFKLEKGTVSTDWTPALEDIDESIDQVQSTADEAKNTADSASTTAGEAMLAIDSLRGIISNLVTDENGESLMTQTTDGWTFNMSSVNGNMKAIEDALSNQNRDDLNRDKLIQNLSDLVDSIARKTAYITMTTDSNGDPCIELGKTSNKFKVRITNTAIDFLEGSAKLAYANNNTFYATRMVVKDELQIGEGPGFIWKRRSNGNLGLTYIS